MLRELKKVVWFRKKVSFANYIICCNYATSLGKGSKNDKKLKLLVVYSWEKMNQKIQVTSSGSLWNNFCPCSNIPNLTLKTFDSACHITFLKTREISINLRPMCHFVKSDVCHWWWNHWISSHWWFWGNAASWPTNGSLRSLPARVNAEAISVVKVLRFICNFSETSFSWQCLW